MLLTKSQQNQVTKAFRELAKAIRSEQQNDITKRPEGKEDPSERFMRMGRQAAYEKCYHLVKTAAEKSHEAEYDGADEKIENICLQMEGQAKGLDLLGIDVKETDQDLAKLLQDQAALTNKFVRNIRFIIHLAKDK